VIYLKYSDLATDKADLKLFNYEIASEVN